jgi:hypothetical protein
LLLFGRSRGALAVVGVAVLVETFAYRRQRRSATTRDSATAAATTAAAATTDVAQVPTVPTSLLTQPLHRAGVTRSAAEVARHTRRQRLEQEA